MASQVYTLDEYLRKSNLADKPNLPLVHSTAAQNLFDIVEGQTILATPCNVFKGEDLCYLFVGRAAYKVPSVENPSEWQLPVVFVFKFATPPRIKRVFPFDSGAFHGKRLPSYITNFKLNGFDISADGRSMGRLISLNFKTPARYLGRQPAGEFEFKDENNFDMRHQELLALSKLYRDHSSANFDDRAAAIEVSVDEDIPLDAGNLLGVVAPAEYMRTKTLRADLRKLTPHIETYDLQPLNTMAHYGLVYDAVKMIYSRNRIKF